MLCLSNMRNDITTVIIIIKHGGKLSPWLNALEDLVHDAKEKIGNTRGVTHSFL